MITSTLQYLLIKLAEEANELSNAASKAVLFNLEGKEGVRTNQENLEQGFNDVYAIVVLLNRVLKDIELPDSVSVVCKLGRLTEVSNSAAAGGSITSDVASNVADCVDLLNRELLGT